MHRPTNLAIKALATSTLVALALLGASHAEAAEMRTSMLRTNSDSAAQYVCLFTNLGTKPVNVTITLTDEAGAGSSATVTAPPGGTQPVGSSGVVGLGRRCTASGKFSTTKARLSMQLIDNSTGITRVAVEGR